MLTPQWETPPTRPRVSADEAQIWRARISPRPGLESLLSPEEIDRANRFHRSEDRESYVFSRALLRNVLHQYLDSPPESFRFDYGLRGKPGLAGIDGVEFNLAHSSGIVLLAIAGRPVGIDLEPVRITPEAREIARQYFAPAEWQAIEAAPEADRPELFLRRWTLREALVKAHGGGLAWHLDSGGTSQAPEEICAHIDAGLAAPLDGSVTILREFRPEPGFVGALTVTGGVQRLEFWNAGAAAGPLRWVEIR